MCDVIEATLAQRKVTARVTGGQVITVFELNVSRVPAGLSHLAGELARQFGANVCKIQANGERGLKITVE
jgi:hypothetical protein